MIKSEIVSINGKSFRKTYSDNNKEIQKAGTDEIYSEAIDILSADYEYVETDKDIESEVEEE